MRLVVAVIQDYDTDRLLKALSDASIGATRIASTGGFLRMGNTTVMMGLAEERVDECIGLLEKWCSTRVERPDPALVDALGLLDAGSVAESPLGGAVVFVLPVERFERMEAH
jgi:uncharacterized protein YaaQ